MTDTSEAAQHRHDYERGANPPPIDTRSVAEVEAQIRRNARVFLQMVCDQPWLYCREDVLAAYRHIRESLAREAADAKARETT